MSTNTDPKAVSDLEYRKQRALENYPILMFFEWIHLPPDLQLISQGFGDLAWDLALRQSEHFTEVAAGLRKLLEAKDCAVRAALRPCGNCCQIDEVAHE